MNTRRDLLNGIVGLSIGTYVIGYAAPIAIDEIYSVVPACLFIGGGETHTIASGSTETTPCVEWEDTGAQLAIEDGGILEVK